MGGAGLWRLRRLFLEVLAELGVSGLLAGGRGRRVFHTDGVFVAEAESEAVNLVLVEGVVVQDTQVYMPLFEVGRRDDGYAWWHVTVHLTSLCQHLRAQGHALKCEGECLRHTDRERVMVYLLQLLWQGVISDASISWAAGNTRLLPCPAASR